MDLSIKEVARILNVSECTVRDYIASGKLPARRKGRRLFVEELQLQDFNQSTLGSQAARLARPAGPVEMVPASEALQPVMDRLFSVERQMGAALDLLRESQRLVDQLRLMERELAAKDLEIEKLRRDLIYQKRICEKEFEERQRSLQEKWELLEKEAAAKIDREREHLENRLVLEQHRWSEKIAVEQAGFAQKLAEAKNQEGFWSRLLKMMTWS